MILKFLEENTIALKVNGKPLNIQPIKWLTGLGSGGDDRMVAYTNNVSRVRFPIVADTPRNCVLSGHSFHRTLYLGVRSDRICVS